MSVELKITISDLEYKALQAVAYDPMEWVENVTRNRARKAIDSIAEEIVEQKLLKGEPVQGTKEQLVKDSDIPTLKDLTDAEEKNLPE